MPIRSELKKATASECSKELRDLSDDEYNQLLATVASWPKKESGILSAGAGAGEVKSGKKLTPAAQSCLNKIYNEVRSTSTGEHALGTNSSFDEESPFMSRRIEAHSAFTPTKKKPVRYEKEDMKFIDEDNDVEMMDLSGSNTTATRTFIRGNREHTATEYTDPDVELGSSQCVDDSRLRVLNGWNEKALQRSGRLLSQSNTILGPHSGGSFFPITSFDDGTDVIPNLTTAYEMPPHSKSLLPTPHEELSSPNTDTVQQPNGVTNNIEDVIAKNAIQDVVVPTAKSELGKRKKNKKDKSKENVIMAEHVPGHMGQLPVEQLVDLIEGKPEHNTKKQSAKEKSEVAAEEAIQTKKERRRKSKELKEAASPSASNTATIGASQTKTGGSTAATATVSAPANTSQPPKMEFTVASKRVTSAGSEKRRGGKGAGAERNVRCSTEDGEEEFLSADEGVASSVGDDTSVPATMVASLTISTNSAKVAAASDVVLDGRNYRADDEDVTQIERQCADEQEFITVNTKKKKLVEFGKHHQQQQQQQRTGSAGKEDRHPRVVAERLDPARRSSVGITAEQRNNAINPPLPSGRRPTTASLADFLDEKDGGKIHNKANSTVTSKAVKKLHRNERQSQPDVDVPLPDLFSGTSEQMSKPATQNAAGDSPERTFSYADAAKKSSEPSRDNSPACVAIASPSAKSDSPAPQTPTPLSCGPVDQCGAEVLPCADVATRSSGVADGLSFFYDESEATNSDQNDQDGEVTPDGAFVLNLGGKTVRFAKGMASPAMDVPPSNSRHMCMVEMLAQRWKMFQEGNVPKIYQPRIASS